jgi:membrane dipeptidase
MTASEAMADFCARTLIWDCHAGIAPHPDVALSSCLSGWRACGVDFISLNIGFDTMGWHDCVATARSYARQLEEMPDTAVLARTLEDVRAAQASGKIAVGFDIEGANALNGDLAMVSHYHDLGVRQMLLAYNLNTLAAGGCHDDDCGLTAFGREVVRDMKHLGMVVDLSHMGRRSSLQAIEASNRPAIFSHSNARALRDHPRNIDDDQIRACAASGGFVGLNGIGIFLGDNDTRDDVLADHVCHIADLVGPEHVALGLDWIPPGASLPDLAALLASRPDFWPPGNGYDTPDIAFAGPGQITGLCRILSARGWTEPDLQAFLGGNALRVAARVWA